MALAAVASALLLATAAVAARPLPPPADGGPREPPAAPAAAASLNVPPPLPSDYVPSLPTNASVELRHARLLGEEADWGSGRCTWYGGPNGPGADGMNIFKGSCGYGNNIPHPYFIAAAQTNGGYSWGLTGQCGRCFEVMCVDGALRGTPSSSLDHANACIDAGRKSVVVMISDSCPCHDHGAGNTRWCCGDTTHMDLSYSAFASIAALEKGVVDLKIRPASCDLAGKTLYYGGGQG